MIRNLNSFFDGRIGRKHWFFGSFVFSLIYLAFLLLISFYLFESAWFNNLQSETVPFTYLFFVGTLFVIGTIVQIFFILSLTARRFHDIGESGWFSLLMIVPYVGLIVCVFLIIMRGIDGENNYGTLKERGFWEDILNK